MSRPVVFIVDDQPFICETIATILKNNYETRMFTSGNEAVQYMSENKADIVLLDYEMPNITGYEVLLFIRSNKLNGKVPVIFLTAETNERMRTEMLERGAADYICKPISAAVLNESIRKHLKK